MNEPMIDQNTEGNRNWSIKHLHYPPYFDNQIVRHCLVMKGFHNWTDEDMLLNMVITLCATNEGLHAKIEEYHAKGLPPMLLTNDQSIKAMTMIAETLRTRVAELEAALRLFMDDDPGYNGGTSDEAYTAGMKAMGLEP